VSYQDLQKALRIIEERGDGDFVGPRSERLIELAETALDLRFPPTYREFLLRLGCGDIDGCEFYGIVDDQFVGRSVPNGIWLTLQERIDSELPKWLVIVYSNGMGTYFAIDTSAQTPGGKNPVVSRSSDGATRVVASDFGEFFLKTIEA
jgi:antitoxin YobK